MTITKISNTIDRINTIKIIKKDKIIIAIIAGELRQRLHIEVDSITLSLLPAEVCGDVGECLSDILLESCDELYRF